VTVPALVFVSVVVAGAPEPAAPAIMQAPATAAPGIADNSFLLEEAYNQEPGVIQHISSFVRLGPGNWAYTFTEEWPAPAQAHQISVTLPFQGAGDHSGLGDAALNYRYQVLDGSHGGVAFTPRLSVLVPTGNSDRALGGGSVGFQANLPVSVDTGRRIVTHSNLGATWVPRARNEAHQRADTWGWNAGQSVIWAARPRIHLLAELVWTRAEMVVGPDATVTDDAFYLSPGIRWAHNFASGLQIVPGIAIPVGIGPSRGDTGVLLYLSFEHPIRK
jgi:hypothetical protein